MSTIKNFPDGNFCQFNESNRKLNHQGSKHWHNCTDSLVIVSIIKEVDGSDKVGDNIWGDKDHVEDEKHDELLNVLPLSTIEAAWKYLLLEKNLMFLYY